MRCARLFGLALFLSIPVARGASIELETTNGFFVSTFGTASFVVDTSGFDTTTGLGTIKGTITPVGGPTTASVFAYFDHEINQATNTFFNEYASVNNLGAVGNGKDPNAWEADEPGFFQPPGGQSLPPGFGDIYFNALAGNLDDTNRWDPLESTCRHASLSIL